MNSVHIYVLYKGEKKVVAANKGDDLLSVLQKNGYPVAAGCGGHGKCNKCKVFIVNGEKRLAVLACKTLVTEDLSVEVPTITGAGLATDYHASQTDGEQGVGLALDIGTTTLAFYFTDLRTGGTLETHSCLNPQGTFGADVISRIGYATEHGVSALTACIKNKINAVIGEFCAKRNVQITRMTVTGNTVMLHVFAGEEISSFGQYPFTPVFLEQREYGRELGYDADKVICLPSFSSFVGADIVCGGIATDVTSGENLLVDLGTNGEMLLYSGGKLYSTSVAAGPAFEGADIECGMGGVDGAISKVFLSNGKIAYKVIGDKPPVGICGAGLVDSIAVMLELGVFDETGAFAGDDDKFYICDGVYISASDVRKFQLAKSAVRAGIERLMKGADIERVDNLYICGGLGYYIDKDNAVKVGLLPERLKDKIRVVGNAAGVGAKMCLLQSGALKRAQSLSLQATNVELSSDSDFTNMFMEYMFF